MNGITPNKAMTDRHNHIRDTGCVVCLRESGLNTPPQIHHITGTKTQDDHARTIGLCYPHHMADQQNKTKPEIYTSRHPNKSAFVARYGTELELLAYQNELLGIE